MSSSSTTEPERDLASAGTTLDGFLGGRLSILQPERGHRAGSDAVFLQAAIAETASGRGLDAGAGVGVAGLCLATRLPHIHVTAVEVDASLCALAEKNAAANGLSARFSVINADVTARFDALARRGIEREAYDEVLANPPYHASGSVRLGLGGEKSAAHVMPEGALSDWIRFFANVTAPKGRLTLIYTPQSLPELLPLLERRFGAISIYPLFPRAGEEAVRVIVQARKGSRQGLRIRAGLVLHEADGRYTAQAEEVLRKGKGFELRDV
jgi:tRNA1(Val) A37 N6-methylase TrmN6